MNSCNFCNFCQCFFSLAPGAGVLHDAGDRDARLGIPAGWATWEPCGANNRFLKRCWKDRKALWNVVGRCWEMLGDVRIRIWLILVDFGGIRWLFGRIPASFLVAWVGTEISVPALWHGSILLLRGLLSQLPEPLRTRLEPGPISIHCD